MLPRSDGAFELMFAMLQKGCLQTTDREQKQVRMSIKGEQLLGDRASADSIPYFTPHFIPSTVEP